MIPAEPNRRAQATNPLPTRGAGAQTAPTAQKPEKSEAAKPAPKMQQDTYNPLDNSPGRVAADVVSGASSTVDTVKDVRDFARIASTVGTHSRVLSNTGTKAGNLLTKVADLGSRFATKMPKLASGLLKLGKASPVIGAVIAGLDVGKAVMEKDPEKKKAAKGQAALSVVGGVAGLIGAAGLTAAGVALAPLAVPMMVVGAATAVVAIADSLTGNHLSKAISNGMDKVSGFFKKLF